MNRLVFFGPKSPPVSGYANIVSCLFDRVASKVESAWHISTVPVLLARFYPGKLWLLVKLAYLLCILPFSIIFVGRAKVVYINLNGGPTLAFDLVVVLTALLFRKRIYLHHNSFSYINRRYWLAKLIFVSSWRSATHVVSTSEMGLKLSSMYCRDFDFIAVSNAAILNANEVSPSSRSPITTGDFLKVGFMGYFDKHKGIDLFVDVMSQLNKRGLVNAKGCAVGPVLDKPYFDRVSGAAPENVVFSRPVYGKQRDKFFSDIDLLLFPSKYQNEAEPLVIHHALEKGVPVIGTNRGCIADILAGYDQCACFDEATYVEQTVDFLECLHEISPKQSVEVAYAARQAEHQANLKMLLHSIEGHMA